MKKLLLAVGICLSLNLFGADFLTFCGKYTVWYYNNPTEDNYKEIIDTSYSTGCRQWALNPATTYVRGFNTRELRDAFIDSMDLYYPNTNY